MALLLGFLPRDGQSFERPFIDLMNLDGRDMLAAFPAAWCLRALCGGDGFGWTGSCAGVLILVFRLGHLGLVFGDVGWRIL